jgi:putative transposase
LTVAIDAYSGYVLGMYLSFYGPGVTSVVGVLRNVIQPKSDLTHLFGLKHVWYSFGLPDEIILDNGLEFHSRTFKAVSAALQVHLTYCRVRTPWLKPHVERFFADLNWLTLRRGRVRKLEANVVRLDPYVDAAIGFGDLVKGLTMFVVDVHPLQINERKLARPIDLFSDGIQRCPPARYPSDIESLRRISAMSKQLTVGPGGVNLLGLPYSGPELLDLRNLLTLTWN